MGTLFDTGRKVDVEALRKVQEQSSNPEFKGLTRYIHIRRSTNGTTDQLIKSGRGTIFNVSYQLTYNNNASPSQLTIFDSLTATGVELMRIQPVHLAGGGDPITLANAILLNTSIQNGIFVRLSQATNSEGSVDISFI